MATGRGGAVAVIVAVAMIPFLVAAGGAIDFARLYFVKSKLVYALDAALLAVGSSLNADPNIVFADYFAANYPGSSIGTATPSGLTVNGSEISASATGTVPTVFLKLAGIDTLSVHVDAQVVRQTTGIELALVLDNTGSMLSDNKLESLKTAAGSLVSTLFDSAVDPDDVKVAVVPFVTAVNIGTGNAAYVQSPAHEYPTNADTSWKGCVEARRGGNDVLDTYVPGGGDQGEWPPYFWQAESYYPASPAALICRNRWWRPISGVNPQLPRPTGHSDDPPFSDEPGEFTEPGGNPLPYTVPDGLGITVGPNKTCPTPVLPLTNVQADVDAAISAMEGWQQGGTIVGMGAVWGWRVLSPDPPFTEGVAYSDPNVNKVLVILTDGENAINIPPPLCGPTNPGRYTSDYTAYGYTSELRLAATASVPSAKTALDNRLEQVCANIKGTGITIYTITLGPAAQITPTITDLMRDCASSSANYFHAPSGAELQTAFQAIGVRLTNLRVAR